MNTFYKSLLLWVVVAMSLTSCSKSEKSENEKIATEKPVKKNFETEKLQFIQPEYEVSFPAELKPYEQVELYAKIQAFVKHLYVDRGTKVRKGQLLALLEAPEINQQAVTDKSMERKLLSDYRVRKQEYDRLLDASKSKGVVAPIELDRARSAMNSASSAYEASRSQSISTSQFRDYLRITSPFDGIIIERNISVGALVGSGNSNALFSVAQGNKLRLILSLPEKHAASVHEGMEATFSVSSRPGKVYTTKLSRNSNLINSHDRSLSLEFDVDNVDGELNGGEFAQVQLKLKRNHPTYWISNESILKNQMGSFVFTLNKNEIKKIPIKEGLRLDGLTEVFGDLKEEDQIIQKPTEDIQEGKI